MTFEEAKKILNKEGFAVDRFIDVKAYDIKVPSWEKVEVGEAMKVVVGNDYMPLMHVSKYKEREARLKEEYGKYHIKGDFSGNKSIEHCGEPISGSPLSAVEGTKLKWKDNRNTSENPALKKSASQFNDALLDEQAKKIKSLVNDITHMDNVIYKKNLEIDKQNQEITRLLSLVEKKENSISRLHYEKSVLEKENEELKKGEIPARYFDKALVDEQSEKIKKLEHEKLNILEMASSCKQTIAELTKEKSNLEDQITILNACKKHNDKIDRKQIKGLGKEIAKLNGIIHDKNAILSDVAEELRLTKIREKNLAELGLKYVGENEKLKKELADKVVDKIDAQALKSAESALAWKEKVIAEKDEVIADLGNELEATKKELEAFKESYKRRIKEDSEHFEHIQKICNAGLQKWLIESEYLEKDKPFRFPQQPELSEEDEMYDSIIERCKRLGIELHYHDGKVPTYTNVFGDEVPVYGLRGIFATCTDEEYKSLFKK